MMKLGNRASTGFSSFLKVSDNLLIRNERKTKL